MPFLTHLFRIVYCGEHASQFFASICEHVSLWRGSEMCRLNHRSFPLGLRLLLQKSLGKLLISWIMVSVSTWISFLQSPPCILRWKSLLITVWRKPKIQRRRKSTVNFKRKSKSKWDRGLKTLTNWSRCSWRRLTS